jgi:hypothetical protein
VNERENQARWRSPQRGAHLSGTSTWLEFLRGIEDASRGLQEHRKQIDALAEMLFENETLETGNIQLIIEQSRKEGEQRAAPQVDEVTGGR